MGVPNYGGRMIYTSEASAAIRSIPMPVEMSIDIVDYGSYLGIRFYESEWKYLSESERMKMAMYFQAVKKTLDLGGIKSTLDPIYDQPGVQKLS